MAQTLLDSLKTLTVVVADTGDFQSMKKFRPRDATTNPSLVLAAAKMPEYADVVAGAVADAKAEIGASDAGRLLERSLDRLAVGFGRKILEIVPGRVSTEVDARLSFDTAASIAKAREIIALYAAAGVPKERVLIKLASTWEGIRAAEVLEREGIHCNLTLLFGFHQAVACADAKVTLISPFVGRILDWYVKNGDKKEFAPSEDPGVVSVTAIYDYYKRHGHQTEVMGASFRSVGEITELAGCDLLTIAPKLLAELEAKEGALPRKLDPEASKARGRDRLEVTEAVFRAMHADDRMAREKLQEGIDGFAKAMVELEEMVKTKLG
ncbi:MAG: transaldolase [Polyangiaceae bacterium]|nr:transaldolase [Polyangiaceae bacterium]